MAWRRSGIPVSTRRRTGSRSSLASPATRTVPGPEAGARPDSLPMANSFASAWLDGLVGGHPELQSGRRRTGKPQYAFQREVGRGVTLFAEEVLHRNPVHECSGTSGVAGRRACSPGTRTTGASAGLPVERRPGRPGCREDGQRRAGGKFDGGPCPGCVPGRHPGPRQRPEASMNPPVHTEASRICSASKERLMPPG